MFSALASKILRLRINKKKAAVSGLLFFLCFSCIEKSFASSTESCTSQVLTAIENKKLYKDPQWLRVLHFRRTFPIFQSQADGKYFFLSDKGMKDPEAEMKTLGKALCDGSLHATGRERIPQLAARCQFPVREKFLQQRLGFNKAPWPEIACPDLEQWRKRTDPGSLTLVFSSYYPNNPSSVFGHTLMRVNRKKVAGVLVDSPLLSQGINYAATSTTSNPVKYALWGLFGGFEGEFASMPYFYKVREYSDAESRDLWEYDLNLTQEELDLFVDHVWELGFTYFNYYYFNENCSYHLLTTLEAVMPQISPSEKIPFWVIPADTIKAVANTPGLVKKVNYRPSVYRQFIARYDGIRNDKKLRKAFNQVTFHKNFDEVKSLDPMSQAMVMDASLDFWDFKHFKDLVDQQSEESKYKQSLLGYRAKLPTTPELTFPIDENLQPDKSHGSMRYGLFAGHENVDGGFAELDLKFALHDLLDDQRGLPDHAKIDFFRLRSRSFEGFKKTRIESFRFADVELLAPLNEFHYPMSWRFTFGATRTRHLFCDGCMAPDMLLQGGYAVDVANRKGLLYALAGGHGYWPEGSGALLSPQFSLGARWNWNHSFVSLLEGEWQHVLGPNRDTYRTLNFETRYLAKKDFALGVEVTKGDFNDFQSMFKLFLYR